MKQRKCQATCLSITILARVQLLDCLNQNSRIYPGIILCIPFPQSGAARHCLGLGREGGLGGRLGREGALEGRLDRDGGLEGRQGREGALRIWQARESSRGAFRGGTTMCGPVSNTKCGDYITRDKEMA